MKAAKYPDFITVLEPVSQCSGGHGTRTHNPCGQLISNQPASHSLILLQSVSVRGLRKPWGPSRQIDWPGIAP